MQAYESLLALLAEKKELLEAFETVSQRMLTCDADELGAGMQERERLIGRIDALDARAAGLCEGAQDPALEAALRPNAARGALPEAARPLYDAARAAGAVVARLRGTDLQLLARFEAERDGVLDQIKASNRGKGAQAARFYGSMGARGPAGGHLGHA